MSLRRSMQWFSKVINDEFVDIWGMASAVALKTRRKGSSETK